MYDDTTPEKLRIIIQDTWPNLYRLRNDTIGAPHYVRPNGKHDTCSGNGEQDQGDHHDPDLPWPEVPAEQRGC